MPTIRSARGIDPGGTQSDHHPRHPRDPDGTATAQYQRGAESVGRECGTHERDTTGALSLTHVAHTTE
ncbi:hypothetical protein C8259_30595 [Nocardia nova]|uniref:Uncharacterized protein n=1 Tax=Nocardia nova TaxID=37330 RepID=A0A2T2YSB6_9NOCA|nr:hypothetical protein C8259_30595 [Nocardia nova]